MPSRLLLAADWGQGDPADQVDVVVISGIGWGGT